MTTCTICVTAIEDDVAALPCRHTFHTYCINRWFNQKTSCPNCNKHFHRNSIIGPLYLEDAATLKSTTASTNDQNNRGVDPAEVLILRQQLAESHKINGHLQRRIVYYKSARNILQPDTITETHEAQARIRQWLELDQEGLANLLEVAATRKAEAERKLQTVKSELSNVKNKLTSCQDEKNFFEKKFNKLKIKFQNAQQKSKSSRPNHIARMYNEAGPSAAASSVLGSSSSSSRKSANTASSSSSSSKTPAHTSTVDSDESTSDEMPTGSRHVPTKRARNGSYINNKHTNGTVPYPGLYMSLARVNNNTKTNTDEPLPSSASSSRNRDSRLMKRTQSEIELGLSDDDEIDNNNNNSSINDNDEDDDVDTDIIIQPRVIDDDNHSEADDGGQPSFDEGIAISTNRTPSQLRSQFRSPSPPVIEISDDEI